MRHNSRLAELGMDLDLRDAGDRTKEVSTDPIPANDERIAISTKTIVPEALAPERDTGHDEPQLDHFVEKDGLLFAGTHLIVDLWEASGLDDLARVEKALRDATAAAGATLLNIDLHHFSPNGGVSGVAVLAESHISIHTWPECGYAAVDIFMCGSARPHEAIRVLREAFSPERVQLAEHKRGLMPC
ncbi:MAG: adenosylmethionine decarboxylase [Salinarimonadaceae bacterium]|nr:MAG: adenosylmethionine decarboxylase [Salinarimonadaceae bacterium]